MGGGARGQQMRDWQPRGAADGAAAREIRAMRTRAVADDHWRAKRNGASSRAGARDEARVPGRGTCSGTEKAGRRARATRDGKQHAACRARGQERESRACVCLRARGKRRTCTTPINEDAVRRDADATTAAPEVGFECRHGDARHERPLRDLQDHLPVVNPTLGQHAPVQERRRQLAEDHELRPFAVERVVHEAEAALAVGQVLREAHRVPVRTRKFQVERGRVRVP